MQSVFISSTKKSSGKTILSIGLARLSKKLNLITQTFKKGPDFIDPSWLARASGTPCYNLDFNSMSNKEICELFKTKSKDSDFKIIEGTKGLYDGVALDGSDSNAELAKLIKSNIILIVDCEGMTRGIAPLLNGYSNFDSNISPKRVILNNVSNTRHENKLISAIRNYTDFKCYGSLPKIDDIINERHLGLIPAFQYRNANKIIDNICNIVKSNVNYNKIIPLKKKKSKLLTRQKAKSQTTLTIGIAMDEAFGFYYQDDIEKFESMNCRIKKIDFIKDKNLPRIDALIIGGGFPETVAQKLASNYSMKSSLRKAIDSNLPVYAECGGLMYLADSISFGGKKRKMCGVLDIDIDMEVKPVGRGLTILSPYKHLWGIKNKLINAHEFHYSSVKFKKKKYKFAYKIKRGYGINGFQDGLIHKKLIASYSHLRASNKMNWIKYFIKFIQSTHG